MLLKMNAKIIVGFVICIFFLNGAMGLQISKSQTGNILKIELGNYFEGRQTILSIGDIRILLDKYQNMSNNDFIDTNNTDLPNNIKTLLETGQINVNITVNTEARINVNELIEKGEWKECGKREYGKGECIKLCERFDLALFNDKEGVICKAGSKTGEGISLWETKRLSLFNIFSSNRIVTEENYRCYSAEPNKKSPLTTSVFCVQGKEGEYVSTEAGADCKQVCESKGKSFYPNGRGFVCKSKLSAGKLMVKKADKFYCYQFGQKQNDFSANALVTQCHCV